VNFTQHGGGKDPEIIYQVKEIYDQQYLVVGEVTGEYLVDLILELQEIGFEQKGQPRLRIFRFIFPQIFS
jgi:hypothetical protein